MWHLSDMYEDLFSRVHEALDSGDAHGALRALRSATRFPSELDESGWGFAFTALIQICRHLLFSKCCTPVERTLKMEHTIFRLAETQVG